jgi:hypothetical protein
MTLKNVYIQTLNVIVPIPVIISSSIYFPRDYAIYLIKNNL